MQGIQAFCDVELRVPGHVAAIVGLTVFTDVLKINSDDGLLFDTDAQTAAIVRAINGTTAAAHDQNTDVEFLNQG